MEISYLYIISNGTDLKIGVSKNPQKRLKQLQTGSADKLEFFELYPLSSKRVYSLEKECHQKLQTNYIKRGEWFKAPLFWDVRCVVESIIEKDLLPESQLESLTAE